jgi:hypothetical protein
VAYDYTPVSDVRVGDYVRSPVVKSGEVIPEMSLEKAWVIGLFVAEGCYGKVAGKHTSIQFCLNKDETEYIERLRSFFKTEYNYNICVYPSGPNGVSVRVNKPSVAEEFFGYTGEYAHHKQLSAYVMSWTDEYLYAVLQGLFDGDGHIYHRDGRRNTSKLNTASPHLAFQVRQLCMRFGQQAMTGVGMVPGGPTNRSNKFIQYYTSSPLFCDDKGCAHALRRHVRDGFMEGTISSLEKVSYSGLVYNLETTSGSYVANGMAVHNCDHIKDNLGEVTADGTKIYMQNPNPKYFDISVVHKPADRIAYSLRKVASAGKAIGGHELAALFGLEESPQTKMATMKALASLIKEIPMTARKLSVPNSVNSDTMSELKKKASLYGLDHVLGYLSNNGFLLSPQDFNKLAFDEDCEACQDTEEGLDDIMEDTEGLPSFEPPKATEDPHLSEGTMKDLKDCCSMEPEKAAKRSIIIVIQKPKVASVVRPDPVAAHGFAMLYKHYKVAFAQQNWDNPGLVRAVAATF